MKSLGLILGVMIASASGFSFAGLDYQDEGMVDGVFYVKAGGTCGYTSSERWVYEQRGYSRTAIGPLGRINGFYTHNPAMAEYEVCLGSRYQTKEEAVEALKKKYGGSFTPS